MIKGHKDKTDEKIKLGHRKEKTTDSPGLPSLHTPKSENINL